MAGALPEGDAEGAVAAVAALGGQLLGGVPGLASLQRVLYLEHLLVEVGGLTAVAHLPIDLGQTPLGGVHHLTQGVALLAHALNQADIAPEDLGFLQALLQADGREKGVFYTPDTVAQHLAENTLFYVLCRQGALPPKVACALLNGTHTANQKTLTFLKNLTVCDPACGTGGFFLASYDFIAAQPLNKDQKLFLKKKTFFGNEIVANTRRLCLMNLYLHNIGELDSEDFISPNDALVSDSGNRYDYVNANPLTNAMLGIRYLIDANADSETPYFTRRAGNDSMTLLENNYYLSVGYMLPYSVRGWSTEYENPFDSLNDYIRAATDGKVETLFEDAGDPSGFQSSITIENEGDGHFRTSGGEGTSGTAEIDYTLNADGQYYVCIDADQTANAKISIAGTEVRTIDRASGAAALVGYGRKGDQLKIRITYREDKSGPIYCKLARFNEEKWKEAYKLLSSEQMEVSDYGDTYIKGKIHAESDGVFLTSVLNEEGWKLYIDGKETEITPVGNFISAEFAAGEHDIELRYMSPGFIPGVILTIAAMIILGILCRYKGKIAGLVKIKKKEKMQAAGDEQKTGDEQNHEDEQNREAVNEREDVQESLDKQERENGQEQKNE